MAGRVALERGERRVRRFDLVLVVTVTPMVMRRMGMMMQGTMS
jgi:hypothetical protein